MRIGTPKKILAIQLFIQQRRYLHHRGFGLGGLDLDFLGLGGA
jgi:hypothetical protein